MGNFEPPEQEAKAGAGEGGLPHILRPDQKNEAAQSVSEFGINMVCSDDISLSRTIPDTRVPEWVHLFIQFHLLLYDLTLDVSKGVSTGTTRLIYPKPVL